MRLTIAVLLLASSIAAWAQDGTEPSFEEQSNVLEETITRAAKLDVKHPEHLDAQLDLAQLLARNTQPDNCAIRLPAADAHYKVVTDSLVTPLVLQAAAGRVQVVGYYIEMARSRCTEDAAAKTAAMNAALEHARAAVDGYRGIFMYQPMTIMQFNVAQTLKDLGDAAGAAKELQAAIDLDRTFGFKADAQENFRTLAEWQGKPVTDADVDAFSADFTPRTVALKFGWKPVKVHATGTYDNAAYEGGSIRHTKFTVPMTGALRADKDDLLYELKIGEPKLDASNLGTDTDKKLVALMARILGRMPEAVVTKTGEFKEARDIDAFAKQMNAEIDKAVAQVVPEKDPRHPAVKAAIDSELRPFATPENLLAKIRQGYSLETGLWIDATLEQNGWVKLPVTLSMNGTPQGVLEHTVEASFSRRVPCGAGKPADGCVELLLEAVPTAQAVADVAQKLADANQGKLDYAAATRIRLVVDPDTLVPYENETLRYSYMALSNKGQRAVKISTDRAVSNYRYD